MNRRTWALIRYVILPCSLYAAFFVVVAIRFPAFLGSPPFEVLTAVFALVFAWLLYGNRDVLSR